MDESMTTVVADARARDPAQTAATEAMLTQAFGSFFAANPADDRDRFMIVGRTFHRLAGQLGLRNRARAFSGAANEAQLIHIAAALLEAARVSTKMSLTQLEPHVAEAVARATADHRQNADLDATCAALAEYDASASPEARDPYLRIVELEDELGQQRAVMREMSRESAEVADRLLALENAAAHSNAQLVALELAKSETAPREDVDADAIAVTRQRLEDFIKFVDASRSEAVDLKALGVLRGEVMAAITEQIAKLQHTPAAVNEVQQEAAHMRRSFESALGTLRRDAAEIEKRLYKEFQAEIADVRREISDASLTTSSAEDVAKLRAYLDRKIQHLERNAPSQTGASPATRDRIASAEANISHVADEVQRAASEIGAVRDASATRAQMAQHEATSLREELETYRAELANVYTSVPNLIAKAVADATDALRRDMQTLARSLSHTPSADTAELVADATRMLRAEMRTLISQSAPRDSAPRMTQNSAASDTVDVLVEQAAEQQRAAWDRFESKGKWQAPFIAHDAAMKRVFDTCPSTYSWLKPSAYTGLKDIKFPDFNAHMPEMLRRVAHTLAMLESCSADELVAVYFKRVRENKQDLYADEVARLRLLADAAGASEASRAQFVEELAVRLDRDTKAADRDARLHMLAIAREPHLRTRAAQEFDKVLAGERALGETADGHTIRIGKKKGF